MMAEARLRGIPVALVNARLSARSERRFRRFRFLVAPIFRRLDLVCIPEANDIPRWARLGVNPSVISLTGNIKYDTVETSFDAEGPRKILNSIGIDIKCPIIFGGSTHPGEEMILARVFSKLRGEFPSLVLVIAPRHVERAREIRASLEKLSLRVAIRSETGGARPDCLLIDTTGELRNWYSVATVVFVGKSLAVHGGQNPVEAIVAGKPVIFGPHMENFETLARSLVEHRGAIQIGDEQSLEDEAGRLLRDQMSRQELVIKAAEVLAAHRDATATTAALVTNLKSHTTLREDPTGKLLATP
jgi:3-deoxy-D-manno-octulosonic-acid transferase